MKSKRLLRKVMLTLPRLLKQTLERPMLKSRRLMILSKKKLKKQRKKRRSQRSHLLQLTNQKKKN